MVNDDQTSGDGVRLDVWLDVACVFKTRSEAQKACKAGKVAVNGQPAKPNRRTRPGDELEISRPFGRRQRLRIVGLTERHVPKAEARQLYEDQAFLAKVYLAAPVYFSDCVWINYREHPESCMARFSRDGHDDEVRLYFLNWLGRYLTAIPHPHPDVRAALQRSLWRFRHPVLSAAVQRSSAVLQIAQRVAGRLKRAVMMDA